MGCDTILHWNINRVGTNWSKLVEYTDIHQPMMICLNKTRCRGQPLPDIDGYHVAVQSSRELNLGGGTAIIINNFSVVMVASTDINTIDIYIGKDTMCEISAYWGPITGSNCFQIKSTITYTQKHITACDLNGHHGAWGSTSANNRGTEIYN
jgi:hypothetical protein